MRQTFIVENGAGTILFAFIPTENGYQSVTIGEVDPSNPKGFKFKRVEIDVVN